MIFKATSFKDLVVHLVIVISLSVALVLLFFYVYLPNSTRHGETVTVPSLIEKPFDEVETYLSERNLRFQIDPDSSFNEELPPLTVLNQYPAPKSIVKEDRSIHLVLNARIPPMVKMPQLTDLSFNSASLTLKNLGLKMGDPIYKPDFATNAVLEQLYQGEAIEPGTEIYKGSEITLVIGSGRGNVRVEIPNLVDMPFDEAATYLQGIGLKIGVFINEPKPENYQESSEGLVTRQFPEAGESIKMGSVVDLYVFDYDKMTQEEKPEQQ